MVYGVKGIVLLVAAWWFCDGLLVSMRYVGSLGLTIIVFTTQRTLVFC